MFEYVIIIISAMVGIVLGKLLHQRFKAGNPDGVYLKTPLRSNSFLILLIAIIAFFVYKTLGQVLGVLIRLLSYF